MANLPKRQTDRRLETVEHQPQLSNISYFRLPIALCALFHEYAFSPAGPWPLSYMLRWVSNEGENIPQAENGWSRVNEGRYNNPEYDALYEQAATTADPDEAARIFIEMNDIIINDVVLIPIVQRASEKYGLSKRLNKENIAGGPFEALYWNIANWNEVA